MTRTDLAKILAKKTQMTLVDADIAIKALICSVGEGLVNDGEVTIRGFGAFKTKNKSECKGLNMSTGKPVVISARRVCTFKAYEDFKKTVNS